MNPKIIFKKRKGSFASLEEQRAVAKSLIFELVGLSEVTHSETGRPVVDKSIDVSISHKKDLVYVGIVPIPYRIGVDVEHIKTDVNVELFLKSVITQAEVILLEKFCENKKIPISSGVAILWSIKEAFFKCLDYDFMPGKISIIDICKNGKVKIACSNEIKSLIKKRSLTLCLMRVAFNKKHIFSCVVMKAEKIS